MIEVGESPLVVEGDLKIDERGAVKIVPGSFAGGGVLGTNTLNTQVEGAIWA